MNIGRTIAKYGDTGSGKTTLDGELAKYHYKTSGRRSRLYTSDMGGYQSLLPLVTLGVIEVVSLNESDDPWVWINNAVAGRLADGTDPSLEGIAACFFDSGSSMSEALLADCARLSAEGKELGGRPAPKFSVKGKGGVLKIGTNVDSHYMVVQSFLLDKIWRSTYLAKDNGVDVVWNFSVHRGENANETPVLGPKLAGKALTAAIPKWFDYTFRVVSIPQLDGPALHRLYMQEQPEGMSVTFGNSRYPLDATTPLPVYVEPASIVNALALIDQGQAEALSNLKEELGM
jgi:hypothetical protein